MYTFYAIYWHTQSKHFESAYRYYIILYRYYIIWILITSETLFELIKSEPDRFNAQIKNVLIGRHIFKLRKNFWNFGIFGKNCILSFAFFHFICNAHIILMFEILNCSKDRIFRDWFLILLMDWEIKLAKVKYSSTNQNRFSYLAEEYLHS